MRRFSKLGIVAALFFSIGFNPLIIRYSVSAETSKVGRCRHVIRITSGVDPVDICFDVGADTPVPVDILSDVRARTPVPVDIRSDVGAKTPVPINILSDVRVETPVVEQCRYVIQIASGLDKDLVAEQATALQKKRLGVRWEKKTTKGVDRYRIITGCFQSHRQARKHMTLNGFSDEFPGSFVGNGLPILESTPERKMKVTNPTRQVPEMVVPAENIQSQTSLAVDEPACRYVIQLASSMDGDRTKKRVEDLRKRGMDVRWEKKQSKGKSRYRIATGCFVGYSKAIEHMTVQKLNKLFPGCFVDNRLYR